MTTEELREATKEFDEGSKIGVPGSCRAEGMNQEHRIQSGEALCFEDRGHSSVKELITKAIGGDTAQVQRGLDEGPSFLLPDRGTLDPVSNERSKLLIHLSFDGNSDETIGSLCQDKDVGT